MSALETGLLQEDDLGCWKHWCKTKKERDHQLCVWGSILVAAVIVWVIVLSVMVFYLLSNDRSRDQQLDTTFTDVDRRLTDAETRIKNIIACIRC